jgi:hypothetical protein
MSLKLRALSLGVLAAMTLSAIMAANASANGNGHFVSETTHTEVKGFELRDHSLHFANHGSEGEFGCEIEQYTGTAGSATKTVTAVTINPAYEECYATSSGESMPIDINGCTYEFTVEAATNDNTEQTAHLRCPTGQSIKITHLNCTTTIHPQTINTGLTYTHITNDTTGKNEVTMRVTPQFTTTRHGLCQFIAPTNGTGTLSGSVTVQGFSGPNQVSITAT